jgi:hypothetical protein
MKKVILMSMAGVIFLSACQKKAENNPSPVAVSTISIPPATQTSAAQTDTVPDGAQIRLTLKLDSATVDETSFGFKHSASCNYSNSEDAPYFAGFGNGSLSSLTRDGVKCAVQTLPSSPGAIRLKVTAKKDGVYILKTSFTKNLPAHSGIWLKDAYRKDSLNIRLWDYRFDIIKSDTNTYSAHRFSFVIH